MTNTQALHADAGDVGAAVLDESATDAYPLLGLLSCRCCEQRLGRAVGPAGIRTYGCAAGCRSTPIDAAAVERVVLDTAERIDPALVASVVVGADPTDVYIFWT